MNRQMRRINEKSEKKKDREKSEKIAARRAKLTAKRSGPKPQAPTITAKRPATGTKTRQRNSLFLGVLALATAVMIILSTFMTPVAPEGQTVADMVMNSLFYLLLGYAFCRWFLGRGLGSRALPLSVLLGLTLGLGLEFAKFAVEGLEPNPLTLLFIMPALFVGAFTGVFIDRKLHGPS